MRKMEPATPLWWNGIFRGIDLNTVGLYHATGRLTAPENTVFADRVDFPEITIPVSVQAPDRPDINCFLAARGNLYFPWVTPPGELDKISVWLSENNGSWNQSGKWHLRGTGNALDCYPSADAGQRLPSSG